MPRSCSICIQSDVAWRCRAARLHRAGEMDGPAIEEELLREGGLPGVRVTDDGEGAPRADRVRQLAFEFERQTELPRVGSKRTEGPTPKDQALGYTS